MTRKEWQTKLQILRTLNQEEEKLHKSAIRRRLRHLNELSGAKGFAATKDRVDKYLNDLEAKGWITHELENTKRSQPAKYFRLTDTGREKLSEVERKIRSKAAALNKSEPPETPDKIMSDIAELRLKLEKGDPNTKDSLVKDLLAALIDSEIAYEDQDMTPDDTVNLLLSLWEGIFPDPPESSLVMGILNDWMKGQNRLEFNSEGLVTRVHYNRKRLSDAMKLIHYIAKGRMEEFLPEWDSPQR